MATAGQTRARSELGAAAVEFALIAIILLTLLIGIIQFSIWFWGFQVGSHAAREGARQYAVHPCDAAANNALAESRVGSAAASGLSATGSFTKASGNTGPAPEVGDEATVVVTFEAHRIGGLIPVLPTITKSATTRVEYVPSGGC